ncbi:MAG: T9SS type A sorting domain-containing protein [Aequorivita antarctica]
MKKLITRTIFILFFAINLHAQYTFDWMQGAGNYSKNSVMSTVDSEDNLIVTGYWQNFETYTRKYDISGSLLWEMADTSGMSGLYEKPNWINSDVNNNILVVGNIYSYSSSTGWDYPNAIVALKYSPSGTLLWKTVIPISITITALNRFNSRSVVDSSGNLYIGTAINSPEGAVLYKIDPNGNLLSTTTSLENLPRNFSSMRIKDDRIVIATGSPTANVAPVFVYNTSGALLWTAAAEGFIASDIEIDENYNVYVLSSLENAVSPSSGIDMRITKYNSAGTLLWDHDYDFGGTEISRKFVYLNNRISAIGYGGSTPSSAYFDWKTIQTDTDGTLLWSAIYDATTFNDEEPYHILAKSTGEVIVTGKGGPSPDPNNPSFIQMPIVEYSNTGAEIWVDTPNMFGGWGLASMFVSDASLYAISSSDMTVYHYNTGPLGLTGYIQNPASIKVYPNPVVEFTTLEFDVNESQIIQITVFDVLGKTVTTIPMQKLQSGIIKIELDLTELNSGLYFCQIKSNENLQTIKLIKN